MLTMSLLVVSEQRHVNFFSDTIWCRMRAFSVTKNLHDGAHSAADPFHLLLSQRRCRYASAGACSTNGACRRHEHGPVQFEANDYKPRERF